MTRRWQNAVTYTRRTLVPGRWHAYDVDEEAATRDDRNMRRHPATALCGRAVNHFAWGNSEADPLDLQYRKKSWRVVCKGCAAAAA